MDGWYPRLNKDRSILSGSSSIWLTPYGLPPEQISAVGLKPAWAGFAPVFNKNNGTTWFNGETLTGAYSEYIGSDDGRWAGTAQVGEGYVDVYLNTSLVKRYPRAVSPRLGGAKFAWLEPYQSTERVLYVNGAGTDSGLLMTLALSPGGEVLITQKGDRSDRYRRYVCSDSGQDLSIRSDETPMAAFLSPDGQPWFLSQTTAAGGLTLVRPAFGYDGYKILGILNNPDARMFGHELYVVGSENNGALRLVVVDFTSPRTDLRS